MERAGEKGFLIENVFIKNNIAIIYDFAKTPNFNYSKILFLYW